MGAQAGRASGKEEGGDRGGTQVGLDTVVDVEESKTVRASLSRGCIDKEK